MTAYYNENEPKAAAWLRELIKAGLIAPGEVDERSIVDVRPSELAGFVQCHFFAGIGVWSYALRRAGWPDNRPVWTGSCPCQPFSAAGKGGGFDDERHLWPHWFHLIGECCPSKIFGEQVASKHADAWIDLVQDDLEGVGYAFGAVPFPAAGVGAPHIRDRTYWMADAGCAGHERLRRPGQTSGAAWALEGETQQREWGRPTVGPSMSFGGLANIDRQRRDGQQVRIQPGRSRQADTEAGRDGGPGRLADAQGWRQPGRLRQWQSPERAEGALGGHGATGRLADANGRVASAERQQRGGEQRLQPQEGRSLHDGWAGPTNGFWRDADWLFCRDGKWRPVEPGTFPLVDGAPARVGRLRGYGNAINAQAAIAFIEAATTHEIVDLEAA